MAEPSRWTQIPFDVAVSIVDFCSLRQLGALLLVNRTFCEAVKAAPSSLLSDLVCEKYSIPARRVLELWRPGGMTDWQRAKLREFASTDLPLGPVDERLSPTPGHIGLAEVNRLWQDRKTVFNIYFGAIEPTPDFNEPGRPHSSYAHYVTWRGKFRQHLGLSFSEFREADLKSWRADMFLDGIVYRLLILFVALYPFPDNAEEPAAFLDCTRTEYLVDLSVLKDMPLPDKDIYIHGLARLSWAERAHQRQIPDKRRQVPFDLLRAWTSLYPFQFYAVRSLSSPAWRHRASNGRVISTQYLGSKIRSIKLDVQVGEEASCGIDSLGETEPVLERRTLWIRRNHLRRVLGSASRQGEHIAYGAVIHYNDEPGQEALREEFIANPGLKFPPVQIGQWS